jgi:hypothetical protein
MLSNLAELNASGNAGGEVGEGGGFGVRPLARVANNLGDVPHQNCQPPSLNEAFYLAVLEEPLKLDNYISSE